MTDALDLTLAEARDALKAKRISATEMSRAFLAAMEKARSLNAYVLETPEQALAMAAESDARLARGEARQTIRLAAAPSIRGGAHKDAEIRLIGAHTLGATIEQELGAVFITRRSDNVAVDLLGLSPKERARLRDGAEIQIGQLYTLTVTSAARAGG